jgi:hypothetical protein
MSIVARGEGMVTSHFDAVFETNALFEVGDARVSYTLVKPAPMLLRVPTGVLPRAHELAGRRAQIIASGGPRCAGCHDCRRVDLTAAAAAPWNVAAGLKLARRTFGGHARPGWKEFLSEGLLVCRNMSYDNLQGVAVKMPFGKHTFANALKEFVE